jgi:hypothetical protein
MAQGRKARGFMTRQIGCVLIYHHEKRGIEGCPIHRPGFGVPVIGRIVCSAGQYR